MNNLFIPYELNILARKFGFNEKCFGYYDNNKQFYSIRNNNYAINSNLDKYLVSAILYQQIIDWLRDVHKISVNVLCFKWIDDQEELHYWGELKNLALDKVASDIHLWEGDDYNTYYEALNKAIEKAFKLIN